MKEKFDSIPISKRLDDTIRNSIKEVKLIQRKKTAKKMWITCGSMAAVFMGVILLCATNPVLASNIPIIKNIFGRVEKEITFSGDFEEKAEPVSKGKNGDAQGKISVKDNQLEITAQEIYCDGISAYITFRVKAEKGFGELVEYYSSVDGKTTCAFLNIGGYWSLGSEGKKYIFANEKFEGEQIDQYNFEGILKIDLFNANEIIKGDNVLNISFSRFASSLKNESSSTKGYGFQINGNWNLELPVKVDEKDFQKIILNDINKKGYGLKEVIITPFEIKLNSVAPKKSYTQKEWKEKYRRMKKKFESIGRKNYEEELNEIMKEFENRAVDYGISVFDQNGKKLEFEEAIAGFSNNEITTYSVKGRKLTKLYIYFGRDWIDAAKENNKDVAESKAIYKKIITL